MGTATRRLDGDPWVELDTSWRAYLRLDRERGERANPRLIYSDGRLTIVTRGYPYELLKMRLSFFLELVFIELKIPHGPAGEMTLKQGNPTQKGIEADTSYYVTNLGRLRGKRKIVMGVDPAPDLAVEIVISHPVEDSLKVYAAFGVREVWVCREEGLTFLVLGDEGRYEPTPVSAWLPFLSADEMGSWLFREDFPDELTLRLAYRDWVINTLAPRHRQHGGPNL